MEQKSKVSKEAHITDFVVGIETEVFRDKVLLREVGEAQVMYHKLLWYIFFQFCKCFVFPPCLPQNTLYPCLYPNSTTFHQHNAYASRFAQETV